MSAEEHTFRVGKYTSCLTPLDLDKYRRSGPQTLPLSISESPYFPFFLSLSSLFSFSSSPRAILPSPLPLPPLPSPTPHLYSKWCSAQCESHLILGFIVSSTLMYCAPTIATGRRRKFVETNDGDDEPLKRDHPSILKVLILPFFAWSQGWLD